MSTLPSLCKYAIPENGCMHSAQPHQARVDKELINVTIIRISPMNIAGRQCATNRWALFYRYSNRPPLLEAQKEFFNGFESNDNTNRSTIH